MRCQFRTTFLALLCPAAQAMANQFQLHSYWDITRSVEPLRAFYGRVILRL